MAATTAAVVAEEDTELRDLLVQTLENSGVLNRIKVRWEGGRTSAWRGRGRLADRAARLDRAREAAGAGRLARGAQAVGRAGRGAWAGGRGPGAWSAEPPVISPRRSGGGRLRS